MGEGDSGIGRAAAEQFAKEGANVTIVYLPEEEEEYAASSIFDNGVVS